MNGWDVFTWFNAIALSVGTSLIFIFFLRDARSFLKKEQQRER